MEAGGLSCPAGAGSVVDAAGGGLDAPWFEPLRPWALRSDPRAAGRTDLALLNRFAKERAVLTEDGVPLRFVAMGQVPAGAYEQVIRDKGEVPTRVEGAGMLHDWFNALAWLAFPRTKARLNRLHCDALAGGQPASAGRGALRDAATLLDENGALFVCRDPRLSAGLRHRDWRALFVDGRERFARHATVRVLGHGLSEKLLAPYKAVCAHAWIVELPPQACGGPGGDALDAMLAQGLRSDALRAANLCPLPLLGVPGWWPANADPAFYDDAAVFRSGRRTRWKEEGPPSPG
jgi:hypothetical protein